MRTIVTAGQKGADADVLGCAVAYAELLRAEGIDAVAYIPGAFTGSVTPALLKLNPVFVTNIESRPDDRYVLVDISDPKHFAQCVDASRIDALFDHRKGYEQYWDERLGTAARIEMVGSCGTLIYEQFVARVGINTITKASGTCLLAAIASNCLAMKSRITTDRDRVAYRDLLHVLGYTDAWIDEYFIDQQNQIVPKLVDFIRADTKTFTTDEGEFAIGQVELWDAGPVVASRTQEFIEAMKEYETIPWFVNVLSLGEEKGYFVSTSKRGIEAAQHVFNATFDGPVAKMNEMQLRKELMVALQRTHD